MAPLHGGSSAGKSGLCCDSLVRRCGPSGFAIIRSHVALLCWLSLPGPRKNDLTIYWAFGPFVRSFTPLVDPGDIYPPQSQLEKGASSAQEQVTSQAEEAQQRRLEPGQVVRWQDRPWSQAAEAMSRAGVLGGQLAEATEWSVEPSARAGFLEETLVAVAQARC
jgi:hypothetical protein